MGVFTTIDRCSRPLSRADHHDHAWSAGLQCPDLACDLEGRSKSISERLLSVIVALSTSATSLIDGTAPAGAEVRRAPTVREVTAGDHALSAILSLGSGSSASFVAQISCDHQTTSRPRSSRLRVVPPGSYRIEIRRENWARQGGLSQPASCLDRVVASAVGGRPSMPDGPGGGAPRAPWSTSSDSGCCVIGRLAEDAREGW